MTGQYGGILIAGLALGLVGWLLVAPLVLVIDSTQRCFTVQWQGLASAQLISGGRIRLWVLGWTTVIDPWSQSAERRAKKRKTKRPARPQKKRLPLRILIRKGRGILRTFRVRTWAVDLDTDDYLLNAYLYPVFTLLSRSGHPWRINYKGDVAIKLVLENRLYRIVFALLIS